MSDLHIRIKHAIEQAESLGHEVYIPNVWGAYTMLECKHQRCIYTAILKWYPKPDETELTGRLVTENCKG